MAFTGLSAFAKEAGADPSQVVLTSPEVVSPIEWNELVVSWNAGPHTALQVEARALSGGWSSRFYNLGSWSLDPARHPRTSVNGQKDADGEVRTDTLVLSRLASRAQVRLTLRSLEANATPSLRFLGLCFLNSTVPAVSLPPDKTAWGKALPVPEKNQLDYAGGRDWCSPTSVSMILAYWAQVRQRPDWRMDVPEAARHIHDPAWGGTGNWCFNTALAGSFQGLRSYVTRFGDLAEVEAWTAAGVPVVLSVSFDLLNEKPRDEGTGHLVVCVGFTETGDVILHDPWAPKGEGRPVRRVCSRKNLGAAWSRSQNTVYLIYPDEMTPPANRWGRW